MASEIGNGVIERLDLVPEVAVFDEYEEISRGNL
jgi:hypothetical protein